MSGSISSTSSSIGVPSSQTPPPVAPTVDINSGDGRDYWFLFVDYAYDVAALIDFPDNSSQAEIDRLFYQAVESGDFRMKPSDYELYHGLTAPFGNLESDFARLVIDDANNKIVEPSLELKIYKNLIFDHIGKLDEVKKSKEMKALLDGYKTKARRKELDLFITRARRLLRESYRRTFNDMDAMDDRHATVWKEGKAMLDKRMAMVLREMRNGFLKKAGVGSFSAVTVLVLAFIASNFGVEETPTEKEKTGVEERIKDQDPIVAVKKNENDFGFIPAGNVAYSDSSEIISNYLETGKITEAQEKLLLRVVPVLVQKLRENDELDSDPFKLSIHYSPPTPLWVKESASFGTQLILSGKILNELLRVKNLKDDKILEKFFPNKDLDKQESSK